MVLGPDNPEVYFFDLSKSLILLIMELNSSAL